MKKRTCYKIVPLSCPMISEIIITSETPGCFVLENGTTVSKRNGAVVIKETKQEAEKFLLEFAELKIEQAKRQLESSLQYKKKVLDSFIKEKEKTDEPPIQNKSRVRERSKRRRTVDPWGSDSGTGMVG